MWLSAYFCIWTYIYIFSLNLINYFPAWHEDSEVVQMVWYTVLCWFRKLINSFTKTWVQETLDFALSESQSQGQVTMISMPIFPFSSHWRIESFFRYEDLSKLSVRSTLLFLWAGFVKPAYPINTLYPNNFYRHSITQPTWLSRPCSIWRSEIKKVRQLAKSDRKDKGYKKTGENLNLNSGSELLAGFVIWYN